MIMGRKETDFSQLGDIHEQIHPEDYDDSEDEFETWDGTDFDFELDDDAESIDLSFLFDISQDEVSFEEIQNAALERHLPAILALLTPEARAEFFCADEDAQHSNLEKLEEFLDILYTFTTEDARFFYLLVAEEFEYRLNLFENPQPVVSSNPFAFLINRGNGRIIWQKKNPKPKHR